MDKMGSRIEQAQEEYYKLMTTRRNQLERQLRRIEDLRLDTGIAAETALLEAELKLETDLPDENDKSEES